MQKLSLAIVLFLIFGFAGAQDNPHGDNFSFSCTDCHTTEGWTFSQETANFNHDSTGFILEGQHRFNKCADCHKTLVFSETKTNCVDCHTDMHNNTVGLDCNRCHTPNSWIVENITEIHQNSRFPLVGAHNSLDCKACHTQASNLEFEPLGVECIDCHRATYEATTKPNHIQSGFSTNCTECHKINSHEWSSTGINHDFFPLEKGHEITDCSRCHTNGTLEPVSNDCFSCHEANFKAATNPSHQKSGFSTNCKECHTIDPGWKPAEFKTHDAVAFPIYSGKHRGEWNKCSDCHSQPDNYSEFSCLNCHEHRQSKMDDEHREVGGYSYNSLACFSCHPQGDKKSAFNHNTTNFPLKGAHIQNTCLDCHTTTFSGTPSDCNSCHSDNYASAANPNHVNAGIVQECEGCHNEESWKPSLFDHVASTGFELKGGHEIQQCAECHKGSTSNTSADCISCHQTNYNNAKEHVSRGYPTDCTQCHSPTSWEATDFDHNLSDFPLTGAHTSVDCKSCHTTTYAGTPTDCYACHTSDYNKAENHLSSGYPTDCKQCHSTVSWDEADFDHNSTSFALTGAHTTVKCAECHTSGYTGTSAECKSCHQNNFTEAQNPSHVAAGLPQECETCHTTTDWKPSTFDHMASTGFELSGGHKLDQCSSCHQGTTTNATSDCFSCHQSNYNDAPDHVKLNFPHDCTQCHNTKNWEEANFDHSTTNFALTGVHASTDCKQCHTNGYAGTASECSACHLSNFNEAQNPNHLTAGISQECETCHNTNGWKPSEFDHLSTSGFALTGGHSGKQCVDCHRGTTSNATSDCYSCHQQNYADAPGHLTRNYPHDCIQCHNTNDWNEATFDHSGTNFPLTGAHAATECALCHTNGYAGTPTVCSECHIDNFNTAQNPNHIAAGISNECETCHNTNAWSPSDFNHETTSGFVLDGAHAGRQCSDCHQGTTTNATADCYSCHQQNYNNAKDHLTLNFPHDCTQCHNTRDFADVTFDHSATNFPLTGAHNGLLCSNCHSSGYAGTSTSCYTCHQNDFNQTSNPNHNNLGLSVNCETCHTTSPGWEPAKFPEHNSYYALNGAHAKVENNCFLCHAGNYNNTPNTCYACHTSDYNSTTNPDHKTAQFPTDCETCHTENAWTPSTWDHDSQYFPIYSGKHKGEWNLCSDCHSQPSNYAVFSCIDCHEHNKTEMDDKHKEVNNYAYNSTNCLSCHPTGEDL